VTGVEPDCDVSCIDVAVMVTVPVDVGVKTPFDVIAPLVADHATPLLYAPVPVIDAAQLEVCVVRIDAGEQVTETVVMVTGTLMVTVVEPDSVASCVDVAVIVALPAPLGVNIPDDVIVPLVADHATPLLYAPVPVIDAVQLEVCVVRIDAGEQVTETEVMATGTLTVTVVEPDLLASCVDVAVIVALPAPLGVNVPDDVIVPLVADQVTPLLYAPVPVIDAVQLEVCVVRIDAGEQEALTPVIVSNGCELPLFPPPPQPDKTPQHVARTIDNKNTKDLIRVSGR
jgi:DNA repair protein RadC